MDGIMEPVLDSVLRFKPCSKTYTSIESTYIRTLLRYTYMHTYVAIFMNIYVHTPSHMYNYTNIIMHTYMPCICMYIIYIHTYIPTHSLYIYLRGTTWFHGQPRLTIHNYRTYLHTRTYNCTLQDALPITS